MAVDSRDKRASASTCMFGGEILPNPDGTISQGDRQQASGVYYGIAAALPAVEECVITFSASDL